MDAKESMREILDAESRMIAAIPMRDMNVLRSH